MSSDNASNSLSGKEASDSTMQPPLNDSGNIRQTDVGAPHTQPDSAYADSHATSAQGETTSQQDVRASDSQRATESDLNDNFQNK